MKNKVALYIILFCFPLLAAAQPQQSAAPHLLSKNGHTQLIVDNKPFIMLGGELGNSSASSMPYINTYWERLEKLHLNTLLVPVYWELMEPEEGKFNFSLVDQMLEGCRQHHFKAVLLWFGSWKNSMSCYAPLWVKKDIKRFPRALALNGKPQEILTPFEESNVKADQSAFAALMAHIKETDEHTRTVLMVQVENEVGMLPDARDHHPKANAAFQQPVPPELLLYLNQTRKSLVPEMIKLWETRGNRMKGNWEEVFGHSDATEELFMAWYFARYVQKVSTAGKAKYSIPMYVNAALNRPDKRPGEYPSAGPLPHLMDIWKAGAPAIDILSPDIYFPDLKHWTDLYARQGNPLFIPETGFGPGYDAKALYCVGHYGALGFSPFSIESISKPEDASIGKAYEIIAQLSPLIVAQKGLGKVDGVLLDQTVDSTAIIMGDYVLTFKHDYTWGRSEGARTAPWPQTGGIVVSVAPDEYYIGGTGIIVTFKSRYADKTAGIGAIDEGQFVDGVWLPGRRMNGDEDHQGRHLRLPVQMHGIQRVKLYSY